MRIRSFEEYKKSYQQSINNPEMFWDGIARNFSWKSPWNKILNWDFERAHFEWYAGGKLNITENCLDRHIPAFGNTTAVIWEPNDPSHEVRKLTYAQLLHEVNRTANLFKHLGIKKGDKICFYMPMIPELMIGVLACARIGAVHSVVFGGFSARSLSDRMQDAQCKLLMTSDEIRRGAKNIPAKPVADEALLECPSVEHVVVVKCSGAQCMMTEGRDHWYHEIIPGMSGECDAEEMDSEDELFILYTSGSTGKPKGVVHTCGGYMVYAGYSFANVFQYGVDESNGQRDVFWCTADVGWITGHTYMCYGPLLQGSTQVMFEGIPTWPEPNRFWKTIDKHRVTHFYTAPTAIRALMMCGDQWLEGSNRNSLKVLGTVGEPINEEAWRWYYHEVGKDKCPIVDTWWQTETGGILLGGLGALSPMKPTYTGYPLPGVQPVLLDGEGKEISENEVEGVLALKFPWPGILRTTYGDHERCRQTYFKPYPGYFFTGDGARRDAEGMYRVIGRVDDVINVSGHRIGTAEVENALNEHPMVVESAVVGFPHDIKGQDIYAFVICREIIQDVDELKKELEETVSEIIGKFARPGKIQLVNGLPKTRSGKIMRRILRKIACRETENLGDTSTLLDPSVVEDIQKGAL